MVKVKTRPKRNTHNREMLHKSSVLNALHKSIESGSDLLNIKRQSSMAKLKRLMTGLKKKDKLAVKKNYLHRKIKKIKSAKIEDVARKRREKQPIVHDLKPLLDALPTDEEMKERIEAQKSSKEVNVTVKQQHKRMMDDINVFKQVLQDPQYTSDPFQAITTHVANMVEAQNQTSKL